MPVYLFCARGLDGEIYERIDAVNLKQARDALENRGYREIEFLSDENVDDIRRAALSGTDVPEADPEVWTAADEVAAHRRKGIGAFVWWAFKQHLIVIAPLAFWNYRSFLTGRPYTPLDWLGFGATLLYLGYFFALSLPAVIFKRLLEASVWCDWPEVRRCIRWARRMRKIKATGIPESELDFREAYALASEGHLSDALRIFEKYRGDPDITESIFLSRLSSVYEYAQRYDEMIRLRVEAATKGPGGVGEWIDVAMARVHRQRDVAGARAALAGIENKEVNALASAALLLCRGMMACEEQDDSRACEFLVASIEKFEIVSGSPLIEGFLANARAYLAISQARSGRRREAQHNFAAVQPLLKARKETELLARCQAALAI